MKTLEYVDIEINAWSSIFVIFKINLILSFYQQNCVYNLTNQVREKAEQLIMEAGKFEILSAILWENSYWSETGREKKSGLRRKLMVSTLDIPIKQLGFKVSNSEVFSSELTVWNFL